MLGAGKRAGAGHRRGTARPETVRRAGCCWIAWASASGWTIARPNSPAASGSGWPWPGRWSKPPDLLLADEPTGNLDHATAERVGRLMLGIATQEQMI